MKMSAIRSVRISLKAFFIILALGYLIINLLWADERSAEPKRPKPIEISFEKNIITNNQLQKTLSKSENEVRQSISNISIASTAATIGKSIFELGLNNFKPFFRNYSTLDKNSNQKA